MKHNFKTLNTFDMKQKTNILKRFKQWILFVVIGRFWQPLMKDIPQRCLKCKGKVKMKSKGNTILQQTVVYP